MLSFLLIKPLCHQGCQSSDTHEKDLEKCTVKRIKTFDAISSGPIEDVASSGAKDSGTPKLRSVLTSQSMFDQSIKLIWISSKYFETLIKIQLFKEIKRFIVNKPLHYYICFEYLPSPTLIKEVNPPGLHD